MNEKMLSHFGTDSIPDSAMPTTKLIEEQLHKDEDAELLAKANRAIVIAEKAFVANGYHDPLGQWVSTLAAQLLAKMK